MSDGVKLCRSIRDESRSVSLCCSAARNSSSPPLASYPFRQLQQQHVFVEAFRNLMMHLNSPVHRCGALVHTTSSAGFSVHPVTQRDVRAWEAYAGGGNLAIYVEAIDDPSTFCGSQATGGAVLIHWVPHASQLRPCRLKADMNSMAISGLPAGGSCSESECHVLRAQAGAAVVEGSVGDCCDDHNEGAASHQHTMAPEHSIDHDYMSALHGDYLDVQYYGCVTRGSPEDGCFLIKTTRQQQKTSCHCMHFSLMRVCSGKALSEQMSMFWRGPSARAQA